VSACALRRSTIFLRIAGTAVLRSQRRRLALAQRMGTWFRGAKQLGGFDEPVVILAARRTASKMSSNPRVRDGRLAAGELFLHVPVEHLETRRAPRVNRLFGEQLIEPASGVHPVTVTP
jgi:hypothetical protein